jgi:serine/threonine-protein kinase
VTPDGKTVVFHETQPNGQYDVMTSPLENNRTATPLIRTNFNERNPQISPDGQWIAFDSDASGRFEIYVRPFPDVQRGQWQVSTSGGEQPIWSRDGGELFYRSPSGAVTGVRVQPGSAWSAGKPVEIVKTGYWAGDNAAGFVNDTYDVARDGRFLVIKEQTAPSTTAPTSIVVVQNWLEELKRLVPTK